MINELTPTETEYMEYLETPKTTRELMAHFLVEKNTVLQIMRTLRLKRLAHRTQDGFWKITEDSDDVPSIPVTQLQTKYLEYLRTPHTTTEMVAHFGKSECAVQQVTRTLRLMGHVESVGIGSHKGGGGGCWKIWETTDEGIKAAQAYTS
jgi:hypothetical protein